MKTSDKKNPIIPEKTDHLGISQPKKNSAGIPAVLSAVKHATKYMKLHDAWRLGFQINQKDGFDCPGCAWPDPDKRSSIGEYCENGIKAIAEEASKQVIGADFFKQHRISDMMGWSDYELGKSGRLIEPMYKPKDADHYQSISWEDAYKKIAEKLKTLAHPDEAIFYTSGRTSNEAAFLYQLFVRAYGTNNLPDCSNMCHESSGVGLSSTVGIGKGSVRLSDLHAAELIIVMGQNPGTNHPRMLSALEKCKDNGGQIISVNPIPEAGLIKYINPQSVSRVLLNGLVLTDLYLPVRINGDVPFLKAVMIRLLQMDQEQGGIIDHDFIKKKTSGYDDLVRNLENTDLSVCIEESGLEAEQIEQAVKMIADKQKIIICWAMGLTQHVNGVDNITEIVNLLLLKGAIGKVGAGTCPVRGHSNVQGDRTMGIWEAPKNEFLDQLDARYNITSPREHGLAVVPAIEAMHQGKGKFFFALGGNFISATPDTEFTAEALRKCEMTVQVSTKLNRSHLVTGTEAMILPCLGRTNKDVQATGPQFVTCENSMGVVHSSQGIIDPPSDLLKSEVAIIAELGEAVLLKERIKWTAYKDNYDLIRDEIEAVIPGFEQYNERVRKPGGFELPNGAREQEFHTSDGKAQFTVNALPRLQLAEDEYVMMTIRSHDQFNTTIYGMDDRYRGITNERRVILMNASDMKRAGLQSGDKVNLSSTYNGHVRRVHHFMVVPYPIPSRNVATYFPETNPLVPIELVARKSLTPASKMIQIRVEKQS